MTTLALSQLQADSASLAIMDKDGPKTSFSILPPCLPNLRFMSFSSEQVWRQTKLGKLAKIVRGGSPRPIQAYLTTASNGLNWLKIGDISPDAKFINTTQEYIKPSGLSKTRLLSPGDFILSNSMSFGRPYILSISTCIHDGWLALTEFHRNLDKNFLYYSINSNEVQNYFSEQAAGSGVKNLNIDIVKEADISLPSLPEQKRIAGCLEAIDNIIQATAKSLERYKTYKKGLLQKMFPEENKSVPVLRFPSFHNKKWLTHPLGELVEFLNNQRKPITKNQRLPGVVPYYGASGILDYVNNYIFNEPLLLVGEDGAKWAAYENKSFSISGKSWVNNHAHVMKPLINKTSIPFMKNYLVKINLTPFVTGNAPPKLTLGSLKNIPICLPSLPEQNRIAGTLEAMDKLIHSTTAKLEHYRIYKKGLLQNLFPAGSRQQAAGSRQQAAGSRQQAAGSRQPQLRFPEFRNSGPWEFFSLGDLTKLYQPHALSTSRLHPKAPFPVYGATGIIGFYNSYNHQEEAIAIGCRGSCGNVFRTLPKSWITSNAMVVAPKNSQNLKKNFLRYALAISDMRSVTTGGAQPQITRNQLSKLPLLLPSLPEQKRIADCLMAVDTLIETTSRELESLKAFKQGLLQQMFV
ncbi:restriction endonuclease subunit S [Oecophyllibacter saccharovorans]|uniref:restriction endonuclease subunit S n=1 Tax=Oecophyllibacter saccharovorans TaxID=2558360 RepID=UPI00116A15C5|nr:restriction endonuclease subunit S [Oecophyllibacter saccharovorans]TPW36653.1 restriction endonuclease subunit S [Oecophyllibacter saccharovorans]